MEDNEIDEGTGHQDRPIVNPCIYHPEEECIPTQPHCEGCENAPCFDENDNPDPPDDYYGNMDFLR